MKTRIIISLLFFVSISVSSQTKYAVEFFGGMNYAGFGMMQVNGSTNGITGGIGASILISRDLEILGTTLFTYFPSSTAIVSGNPRPYFVGAASGADQSSYSCEVSLGPRFHGQGSSLVHPFLLLQGGLHLMRTPVPDGWSGPRPMEAMQFFNIHGTEDMQMSGVVHAGAGVQITPSESIRLNLEVGYKLLIGGNSSANSLIPVVVSVQLPV